MNDGDVSDATMNFELIVHADSVRPVCHGCTGSRMGELQRPDDTRDLLGRVSALIEETHAVVVAQVNAALTLMNWHVGHLIDSEILGKQRAEYAEEIVATLSPQLTKRYGG